MDRAGITKAQMARALNVNGSVPGRWTAAKSSPSAEHAVGIAHLTGCNLQWLLTGVVSGVPELPDSVALADRLRQIANELDAPAINARRDGDDP